MNTNKTNKKLYTTFQFSKSKTEINFPKSDYIPKNNIIQSNTRLKANSLIKFNTQSYPLLQKPILWTSRKHQDSPIKKISFKNQNKKQLFLSPILTQYNQWKKKINITYYSIIEQLISSKQISIKNIKAFNEQIKNIQITLYKIKNYAQQMIKKYSTLGISQIITQFQNNLNYSETLWKQFSNIFASKINLEDLLLKLQGKNKLKNILKSFISEKIEIKSTTDNNFERQIAYRVVQEIELIQKQEGGKMKNILNRIRIILNYQQKNVGFNQINIIIQIFGEILQQNKIVKKLKQNAEWDTLFQDEFRLKLIEYQGQMSMKKFGIQNYIFKIFDAILKTINKKFQNYVSINWIKKNAIIEIQNLNEIKMIIKSISKVLCKIKRIEYNVLEKFVDILDEDLKGIKQNGIRIIQLTKEKELYLDDILFVDYMREVKKNLTDYKLNMRNIINKFNKLRKQMSGQSTAPLFIMKYDNIQQDKQLININALCEIGQYFKTHKIQDTKIFILKIQDHQFIKQQINTLLSSLQQIQKLYHHYINITQKNTTFNIFTQIHIKSPLIQHSSLIIQFITQISNLQYSNIANNLIPTIHMISHLNHPIILRLKNIIVQYKFHQLFHLSKISLYKQALYKNIYQNKTQVYQIKNFLTQFQQIQTQLTFKSQIKKTFLIYQTIQDYLEIASKLNQFNIYYAKSQIIQPILDSIFTSLFIYPTNANLTSQSLTILSRIIKSQIQKLQNLKQTQIYQQTQFMKREIDKYIEAGNRYLLQIKQFLYQKDRLYIGKFAVGYTRFLEQTIIYLKRTNQSGFSCFVSVNNQLIYINTKESSQKSMLVKFILCLGLQYKQNFQLGILEQIEQNIEEVKKQMKFGLKISQSKHREIQKKREESVNNKKEYKNISNKNLLNMKKGKWRYFRINIIQSIQRMCNSITQWSRVRQELSKNIGMEQYIEYVNSIFICKFIRGQKITKKQRTGEEIINIKRSIQGVLNQNIFKQLIKNYRQIESLFNTVQGIQKLITTQQFQTINIYHKFTQNIAKLFNLYSFQYYSILDQNFNIIYISESPNILKSFISTILHQHTLSFTHSQIQTIQSLFIPNHRSYQFIKNWTIFKHQNNIHVSSYLSSLNHKTYHYNTLYIQQTILAMHNYYISRNKTNLENLQNYYRLFIQQIKKTHNMIQKQLQNIQDSLLQFKKQVRSRINEYKQNLQRKLKELRFEFKGEISLKTINDVCLRIFDSQFWECKLIKFVDEESGYVYFIKSIDSQYKDIEILKKLSKIMFSDLKVQLEQIVTIQVGLNIRTINLKNIFSNFVKKLNKQLGLDKKFYYQIVQILNHKYYLGIDLNDINQLKSLVQSQIQQLTSFKNNHIPNPKLLQNNIIMIDHMITIRKPILNIILHILHIQPKSYLKSVQQILLLQNYENCSYTIFYSYYRQILFIVNRDQKQQNVRSFIKYVYKKQNNRNLFQKIIKEMQQKVQGENIIYVMPKFYYIFEIQINREYGRYMDNLNIQIKIDDKIVHRSKVVQRVIVENKGINNSNNVIVQLYKDRRLIYDQKWNEVVIQECIECKNLSNKISRQIEQMIKIQYEQVSEREREIRERQLRQKERQIDERYRRLQKQRIEREQKQRKQREQRQLQRRKEKQQRIKQQQRLKQQKSKIQKMLLQNRQRDKKLFYDALEKQKNILLQKKIQQTSQLQKQLLRKSISSQNILTNIKNLNQIKFVQSCIQHLHQLQIKSNLQLQSINNHMASIYSFIQSQNIHKSQIYKSNQKMNKSRLMKSGRSVRESTNKQEKKSIIRQY